MTTKTRFRRRMNVKIKSTVGFRDLKVLSFLL